MLFPKVSMANRILLETKKKLVRNGETQYPPLTKEWREVMERNNLGVEYDPEKHILQERLMQNQKGQIYFEAWFIIDPEWTAKMRQVAEEKTKEE